MITRRTLLKTSAATGLTIAAGGLAAPAIAQGAKIKLGYVSPQSGPLAAFAEADSFILSNFGATQAAANFEIIVKDSQSNPNRAAEVAKELIVDDEVDMILVASTPETTNPVATTAEAEGVPVISTVAPWPAGQPRGAGQLAAVRLRLSLLLGPGRRDLRLHRDVEPARHQQAGRRTVPQ
jgi:branched-chain amino acid transport system substrate-binding protein